MKERSKEFVRADMVDLKNLDVHLGRHVEGGWTMPHLNEGKKVIFKAKEEWEIDPHTFIIKEEIARGAFGSVHKGVYKGQEVAVKVIDWGEEGQRTKSEIDAIRVAFKQEVSIWYKLDHPNITKFIGATLGTSGSKFQIHNIGMPSNLPCVVAEYLPGGTLKSFLIKNRERKLAFKIVIQLALDLARGLSYLHSKKIVHRDVKTENILLDKDHRLKMTDFGVARVEALNPREMTGNTGTLRYMAPEVYNNEPYNRKCDVYSFGICLWEIYCCDMPYHHLTFSQLSSAVVYENLRPEIPKSCPNSLAEVMKRCWDADPNKRPEMEEVVSLLEAIDQPQGCFCFGRSIRFQNVWSFG